jgi:hypothetical protein
MGDDERTSMNDPSMCDNKNHTGHVSTVPGSIPEQPRRCFYSQGTPVNVIVIFH